MRPPLKNHLKKRRGQSLVEMALFLMIILFILGGAVDFGIGYLSYVAIRDAAQEGAIYGAINPTNTSGIEARVKNSSSAAPVDLNDPLLVTVAVSTPEGTTAGNPITVTVSYKYKLTLPFVSLIIGTNPSCGACIPLRASATGVILVNPTP